MDDAHCSANFDIPCETRSISGLSNADTYKSELVPHSPDPHRRLQRHTSFIANMLPSSLLCLLACVASTWAFDPQFSFSGIVEVENRTIDEIYQAALAEGGIVTLLHGG